MHWFSLQVSLPALTKASIPMTDPIRLACRYCDTSEFDGVKTIPSDWTDVVEVQPYSASREEITAGDTSRSCFEWYTHLGTCPTCAKLYD